MINEFKIKITCGHGSLSSINFVLVIIICITLEVVKIGPIWLVVECMLITWHT